MADDLECDEDLEIDFRRLKEDHLKFGYKEGIEAGEESTLQQGFDQGFADSVSIAKAASKLLGSISAVLCYLNSKKIKNNTELEKDLTKMKEKVVLLELNALKEYEALVTMSDSFVANKVENASTETAKTEEKSFGKNACGDSSECCSSEKDCEKQQQSSCGTNCCSQSTKPHCKNTNELQETKLTTLSSPGSKEAKRNILETFYKDLETIEKQLTVLIEKGILSC